MFTGTPGISADRTKQGETVAVRRESGRFEAANTRWDLLVGIFAIPFQEKVLSRTQCGNFSVTSSPLRFSRNDGQECNVIKGFAENYKTTCKQKFIYRELLAVGSNGNIVKDQFRFPSSCCCHIKNTADPSVRLGLESSDQRSLNRTAIVSKTWWRQWIKKVRGINRFDIMLIKAYFIRCFCILKCCSINISRVL